ncbi:hypothetical protein [Mitsuaria sp. 7]|uniref:hypothetical protein n=1 Tax=Mitsuaria sp. 7 TaxID=1658665 RepID=UPI0012F87F7B|nr:hypothetical protein [Mitsuaria sp. 7]
MERLERGEPLRLSPTVERYLNRVAGPDGGGDSRRFRLVYRTDSPLRPSDDEEAALIAEAPLCLLNGRERSQALASRRHGQGASDAPVPDFSGQAFRQDLVVASMQALNAARRPSKVPWTQALAQLARWETEAPSEREAQARASGGYALRKVVKDSGNTTLDFKGDGFSTIAREFSLPPRALLQALDLESRPFLADLGPARPLDLDTYRDFLAAIRPEYWDLRLDGDPGVDLALIPDCALIVGLRGDVGRCGHLAVALASQPRPHLDRVSIHLPDTASKEDLPQAPLGWRFHQSGSTWTLRRASL